VPIKNLNIRLLKPEEYYFYQWISVVKIVKENADFVVYLADFIYKDRCAWLPILLSREFIEDPHTDVHNFIKGQCLEWAEENYENKN